MEPNPHEELARLHKAIAICDVLDFLGHTPSTFGIINSQDWAGIATLAQVNSPSDKTIDFAKLLLRERIGRREHLQNIKLNLDGRLP